VLIVEDNCLIASLLTDELKDLGYAVVGPARSLAEATSIASTSVLDGALVDIALGEQSALAVATILSDRHIPFVFTTGDNESLEEAFPDVPALGKPFTSEELRHALERLLGN
jgi:CheY-like chemotaxis protein